MKKNFGIVQARGCSLVVHEDLLLAYLAIHKKGTSTIFLLVMALARVLLSESSIRSIRSGRSDDLDQTNIKRQVLDKIFKKLESRHLIKQVKSVTAKSKKMFMLYDLKPSKELTGGVWYLGICLKLFHLLLHLHFVVIQQTWLRCLVVSVTLGKSGCFGALGVCLTVFQ